MILILILKQWLKYLQIAKRKSFKNFTENAENLNTKKTLKTFKWPTVRTTWAEEKRIRPDIMSFEAKEIDVNLKKILCQKEWRLGLWAWQFGGNVGVPGRSFNWSSWYFAEFWNIAVAVFSQTPLNNMRYLLMRGVQFKLCELNKMPLLSSETFWNN